MARHGRESYAAPTSDADEFEPLHSSDPSAPLAADAGAGIDPPEPPFSWVEYTIFTFLGIAMLWAWNMFLAATPYFAYRFSGSDWIVTNFQSSILTVSTLTNLSSVLVLANLQQSASYPFRIRTALIINSVIFSLLTASTCFFLDTSPQSYFLFILLMVACTSWATGLIQNGAFSFASSFGRTEYIQALMAGQGIAGVLPAAAQVVVVLLFPPGAESEKPSAKQGELSAFLYFLAAVTLSACTLVAFTPLVKKHKRLFRQDLSQQASRFVAGLEEAEQISRTKVSLWLLLRKLRWLAAGLALTFAITMFFPVLTTKIRSVQEDSGPLFRPAAFIPLAFVFWNLGDLGGRVATMLPSALGHKPFFLFLLAIGRTGQVLLYLLCNIDGRGAVVSSDLFYLFIVQTGFGLTNGWLGSSFMMAASQWVDRDEREATGGFMGLVLVAGLAFGSLLSFSLSAL